VLIGNKCDSELREIPREEGEFLAKQLGCHAYFECSAKQNIGVDEAFFCLAKNAYEIDALQMRQTALDKGSEKSGD